VGGLRFRWRDAAAIAGGYLVGSLPVGLWLGKLRSGVDVREYGSGATGATNVLRTLGPKAAAATFSLDMAKGSAAVIAARALTRDQATAAAAGVAAVAGHSWPVWAEYRGGKGAATALGALAAVSPRAAVCAAIAGVSTVAVTRRASAGSLTAAAAGIVYCATPAQLRRSRVPLAYSCLVTAIMVGRHKDNIRRLLAGTEPELGTKVGEAKKA
jgi:acyl phosphate:glycerol-3-phosphate acyltransferase